MSFPQHPQEPASTRRKTTQRQARPRRLAQRGDRTKGGSASTPTMEDLASFLQALPPGAHVAVNLGGLDIEDAMRVSRQAADDRGERFIVIGHRSPEEEAMAAASLGKALPLEALAPPGRPVMVFVDAASSVRVGGAVGHSIAERAVGLRLGHDLTVVCLYTEDALAQVTPDKVYDLHTRVATPGLV